METGVNFPDIAIIERLAEELETSVADLLGLEQATSEMVIKGMTEISVEEKDEIKKTMKKRAWITILLGVILGVTEVYRARTLVTNIVLDNLPKYAIIK